MAPNPTHVPSTQRFGVSARHPVRPVHCPTVSAHDPSEHSTWLLVPHTQAAIDMEHCREEQLTGFEGSALHPVAKLTSGTGKSVLFPCPNKLRTTVNPPTSSVTH